MNWNKTLSLLTAAVWTFSLAACTFNKTEENKTIVLDNVTKAKNIILLIGDGMGPSQIKAGEIYKGSSLTLQKFPYSTMVETVSLDGTTDSAAAATAIATGERTENGRVGMKMNWLLGDYEDISTIVDIATSLGKRTGILTTEELYGATPMGFSGHSLSRNNTEELLHSASNSGNVNLFASYTISTTYSNILKNNGYQIIDSVEKISESKEEKIFGSYNIQAKAKSMMAGEQVAFDYLVTEALEYLSQDEDGFFLMAEGAHIDHGGHSNDIHYMLEELLAFDDGVQAALNWAKNKKDTVVIVTADHETGGLVLQSTINKSNMFDISEANGRPAQYYWSTTGHTSTEVYCYINGANIDFSKYAFNSKDIIKNTDIFKIVDSLMKGL